MVQSHEPYAPLMFQTRFGNQGEREHEAASIYYALLEQSKMAHGRNAKRKLLVHLLRFWGIATGQIEATADEAQRFGQYLPLQQTQQNTNDELLKTLLIKIEELTKLRPAEVQVATQQTPNNEQVSPQFRGQSAFAVKRRST